MADETDREEKTEDATPRKREDAREQGQVALSTEVTSAAMLLVGLIVLLVAGSWVVQGAGGLVSDSLSELGSRGREEASVASMSGWMTASAMRLGSTALAVIVPLFAVVLLVCYGQVGFQITPKAIAWDIGRLDPTKGFGKVFSTKGGVRTFAALVKILAITTTVLMVAWNQVPRIAAMTGSELGPVLAAMGSVALRCTASALAAILVLALADLFWQRFSHERELRMSKKEVRDEAKSTEGDPHVKGRIRQIQREMAKQRMMADVPKATVVITNPTHYAVALRYERDETDASGKTRRAAPYVVAKGVDHVAQRIKALASEHGILCYEDVPLARALHAQVEIGEEIPEQLFQAVATVLAYAYRVQEDSGVHSGVQGAGARAT